MSKPNIEPFFDLIIKAIKKVLAVIIKGVLSPVISVLKIVAKTLVNFLADNILKPIFTPIGNALAIIVAPLKPIFGFIGKILDFIVVILRFFLGLFDMILGLPFRILGGMGLITFPDAPDPRYKNVGDLKAINKLSNSLSDMNKNFTDSATNVNKVVNQPNLIIFLTILVLAIIFIFIYYFYNEFSALIDGLFSGIKNFFYPEDVEVS